jgi:hypothetical protein
VPAHMIDSVSHMSRSCGIDVGERRVFPVVIDRERRKMTWPLRGLSVAEAVDWVRAEVPGTIAIDSSPRPNKGLLADDAWCERHGVDPRGNGRDRRVAEWRLGIGGCYSTRSSLEQCPGWMRTGMALFEALAAVGHQVDLGGGGTVIEVHPTFGFRSLLGIQKDDWRVLCDPDCLLRPKQRPGSLGHRQRLFLLESLLQRWGIELSPHRSVLTRSIDWTDAVLAAALGLLREDGQTVPIGDPEAVEGAIVVANLIAPLELSGPSG